MTTVSSASDTEVHTPKYRLICALVAFLCLVGTQIATPLADSALHALTTAVVVTLAIACFFVATFRHGMKEIFGIFLLATSLGVGVEVLGQATGFPFGAYEYTDALQPQVFGVPVVVALAWFGMGLPAWEVSRRIIRKAGPLQWLLGGLLLAAWDLFLDPQMVTNGFWVWENEGFWQGIPWTNYAGWTLVGFLICALCSRVLGRHNPAPLPGLALLYAWMALLETMGFLLPFVFDIPIIGVVGGIAMVPAAVYALRSYDWQTEWARWRA